MIKAEDSLQGVETLLSFSKGILEFWKENRICSV
jgi:hypothetical protein